MRRLNDYFRFAVWQSGLGYIVLWCLTFWALDEGPAIFGRSGVCHPDEAKVLFYWVCDPASALSILASLVNTAFTVTIWSPVYVAAATVRPDAIALAAPIIGAHVIGLPAAIFVAIRVMLTIFQVPRGLRRRKQKDENEMADLPVKTARRTIPARRYKTVKPRSTFGLRSLH